MGLGDEFKMRELIGALKKVKIWQWVVSVSVFPAPFMALITNIYFLRADGYLIVLSILFCFKEISTYGFSTVVVFLLLGENWWKKLGDLSERSFKVHLWAGLLLAFLPFIVFIPMLMLDAVLLAGFLYFGVVLFLCVMAMFYRMKSKA